MSIKTLKKILIITVSTIIALLLMIYLLLLSPFVQKKVVAIALDELKLRTGTEISIGRLYFSPFNKLSAEDIYIEDLQGDTLLYAGSLSAGFDLLRLIDNQLLIKNISLSNFNIRLEKDTATSNFNFQFLIDAFASKDTVQKANDHPLRVEIDHIKLLDGQVKYNHIRLHDLSAAISLKSIDLERLDVTVKHLAFKEAGDFELRKLTVAISSCKQKITAKALEILLPHSVLKIPEASVDYTGYHISQLADSGMFRITTDATVFLPDLKAFFPPLSDLKDLLSWQATASGTFPTVKIETLNCTYGKALSLRANASMANYKQWDETPLDVNISELNIAPNELKQVCGALTGNAPIPEILVNLGNTKLSASAGGQLSQMNINLNLTSAPGKMVLMGTAGYLPEANKTDFDLTIQTDSFNLSRLMQDTIYGNVSLTLAARGQMADEKLSLHTNLDIRHFAFNSHQYQHINAEASYLKNSLTLRPTKEKAHLWIQASIDTFKLSPNTDIHADIRADLYGSTPSEWEGTASINKLFFKNGDDIFSQQQIDLMLENKSPGEKHIHIDSEIFKADIDGRFALETLPTSLMNTFHGYLPALIPYVSLPDGRKPDYFSLNIDIQHTESLSAALQWPVSIVMPGKIQGSFADSTHSFKLYAYFPQININQIPLYQNRLDIQTDVAANQLTGMLRTSHVETDTTAVKLQFSAQTDSINLQMAFNNKSMNLDGRIAAGAIFRNNPLNPKAFPELLGSIYPSSTHFQNQTFEIKACNFSMYDEKYAIHNFEINQAANGAIHVDGILSKERTDSMTVDFRHLQVAPFLEMLRYDNVKLKAEVNGKIVGRRLLDTPVFFTNNFTVKDIFVENKNIGNLNVESVWSERRQAARLNITLQQENRKNSNLSGYILPTKDSIALNIDLQALQMDWLQPFTKDFLCELKGEVGAEIAVSGKMTQPDLQGTVFFRNAVVGVNATNVRYKISDSITISPNALTLDRFRISDFNGNTTTINGKITHRNFQTFNANVGLSMRNFLVLNNPAQTDSLFYGTLKLYGSVNINGTEKGLDVKASIQEGTAGKVYVRLPDTEVASNRYGNITYIQHEAKDTLQQHEQQKTSTPAQRKAEMSLPVNLSLSATVTPDLTLGIVVNPSTKDAATATGAGNIRFDYKMPNGDMKLTGNYTIEEGRCALSLQNITKKEFIIQKGSTVAFKGNPLATTFNVTAIYPLRADLVSLDESFANDLYLSNTRVKTNCILNISGNIDQMNISYDVKTPDVDESVQRKIANLMYSDDIKIREVAYLLALGNFYPPEGNKGTNAKTSIWTTLASSTLSGQLNNLLVAALKENWSIGTNFRSNDDNFSDLEMDVDISTRLFNNRLIVNTNIGYKNNTAQDNNITGDFQVEYKLTRSKALSLKAYNVTNDEYYRQSLTTQGIGIAYRKESKTFGELFRKTTRRLFFRRNDNDHNNVPTTNNP